MIEGNEVLQVPSLLPVDDQYKRVIHDILTNGKEKSDPQGVGNLSVSGVLFKFDLSIGRLPMLSLRDMGRSWKSMVGELLWIIKGSTNTGDLHKDGIHLWDIWAEATQKEFGYQEGDLGPIYGKQWRAFDGGGPKPVDQLVEAMRLLKTNPDSRRIIVSGWNPAEIDKVFVAPCHCFWQGHHAQNEFSMNVFQRSGDMPVGIPFDIVEYSLLLKMVAKINAMTPRFLNYFIGDAHIYKDQIPHMEVLLERESRPEPKVTINSQATNITGFEIGDFVLDEYNPHPGMKIPVAL